MLNRLSDYFAEPSPADKLIAGAYGLKFEVLRFEPEEGEPKFSISYELSGSISADADAVCLFSALLREMRAPRSEGGAA